MLDTKTEAPEILSSLRSLSTFYDQNSPAERRKLRATIEQQGRSINDEFLAAAESVTAVRCTLTPALTHLHTLNFTVRCESTGPLLP